MPKARRKPTDPQEAARQRAERLANEAEIGRLRHQGAVVNLDRARRIVSAYRASAFHKLKETKTISTGQAAAAERLITDWAVWKRLDGKPAPSEVRAPVYASAPQLVTDRMIQAGDRVARVLDYIGPMDRDLLSCLVAQAVEEDRPLPWRDVVRRVTGVTQTVRQSQMIVAGLENLARAYAAGADRSAHTRVSAQGLVAL
jgi:hypothetical protein